MEEKENVAVPAEENKTQVNDVKDNAEVASEPESDFADEMKKPEPEPAKEEVVEEKKEEVDLYLDKEEKKPVEEPKEETADEPKENQDVDKKKKKTKPAPIKYTYDDENLQNIENERLEFNKKYKKNSLWKWLVTFGCLALIILGWALTAIPAVNEALKSVNAQFPMYFTLIFVAVSLVVLLIFSSFFKKGIDKDMKVYFKKFYELQNAYIYPTECQNLEGDVDSKLDEAKLRESALYKDIYKVGSRACLSFDYDGKKIVISDAAAQVQDKKALRTVFVGKFLYFENNYKGDDVLIYFKGNKRALPPTNLAGRDVYKDSKTMVIYGPAGTKKVLTMKVQKALNAFETNATFVDMAISIREGMTYIAMGYEDDLMVLPLEKPFNPAPTKEAKKNIAQTIDLISALSAKE